jgi:23S rRNA pseudouridine955/2504/2580 synthase
MLAAYDDDTERLLVNAIKQHLLKKTYFALCEGSFSKPTGSIISYISKDSSAARVTVSRDETENGLQAKSDYKVIKEYCKDGITMSLLEVVIETGRTHQIRAQLSGIGHPIIGDDKYGDHSANKALGIREMCLASREIRFGSDAALGSYAGKAFICPKEKIKWLTAEM